MNGDRVDDLLAISIFIILVAAIIGLGLTVL